MSFIVESGGGTPNANSYASPTFVTTYLTDRGRETENLWSTITTALKQNACVAATDYLDKRWGGLFKGVRYRSWVAGRAADATLTLTTVPLDTETVVVGQKTYRFVAALAQENDVLQGATASEAASNLAAAVNGSDDGNLVHEDTWPNIEAVADVDGAVVTLTASQKGLNGNEIALTTTVTGATASSATLVGGLDDGPQPLEFPRSGCTDRDGNVVTGVPLVVRQATAEYAVRAVGSTLDADPATNVVGAVLTRTKRVVGPIETENEYAVSGVIRIYKPYPAADRLLAGLLTPAGVIR